MENVKGSVLFKRKITPDGVLEKNCFKIAILWGRIEKARVGCFKRTASKHVYYQG